MGSSWASRNAQADNAQADAARPRERGQALVEFALIAPLFLLVVVGIIQFGIGLNYWLDLERLANQGARWAVVNCNPDPAVVCSDPPASTDLETFLERGVTSGGNKAVALVCFEGTHTVGQPLSVYVSSPYTFLPILDIGTITLRGKATMRIEQAPTQLEAWGYGDC